MGRKNSRIASGLILGAMFLVVIGVLMFCILVSNDSTNDMEYLTFDNSTPEATAISIARLNEGRTGFYTNYFTVDSAFLTSNGKYWIVKMGDGNDNWTVTVDAKTLMSKKNQSDRGYKFRTANGNVWRPLEELKAEYVAEIQTKISESGEEVGEAHKIIMNGKEIWKVPVHDLSFSADGTVVGYVYVDLATGKSAKVYDGTYNEFYSIFWYILTGSDGWLTLKEVDDTYKMHDLRGAPFRDALRDLYPE